MANGTTQITLETRPLQASEGAALEADVFPQPFWQPTGILRTAELQTATVSGSGLTTAGDIWRILFVPTSASPGSIFCPIRMRAAIINTAADAGFASLFEQTALVAIGPPFIDGSDNHVVWYDFATGVPRLNYVAGGEFWTQPCAPELKGYPPAPTRVDDSTLQQNAVGGFSFTVDTWDATAANNSALYVDCAWLEYPQNIVRSAGYWTPRQFFRPS